MHCCRGSQQRHVSNATFRTSSSCPNIGDVFSEIRARRALTHVIVSSVFRNRSRTLSKRHQHSRQGATMLVHR